MRLNLNQHEVIRGGTAPIRANSQKTTLNNTIFKIVTSGLYIRPIEAIVREISTNALDGHIAAGCPEKPFEITVPTKLDPYFIVRDFGISMDEDTVFDVYAVLGESTKNATSNSIGGWGVGGKSPAAYTDTFFITTYLNGVKSVYQSSCLPDSTPLELLLQVPSDEPTGVEVKIPVMEKDFERFETAIKSQLAPFDVKPIINGKKLKLNFDLSKETPIPLKVKLDLPNDNGKLVSTNTSVNVYEGHYGNSITFRMGCVIYQYHTSNEYHEELSKLLETVNKFDSFDFLIDLPIDAVDIKPSREDLDYTPRTLEVLKTCFNALGKHITKHVTFTYFKARHLKYPDLLEELKSKLSQRVVTYILNTRKHKPWFMDKRVALKDVPQFFHKKLVESLREKELEPEQDFRIVNTYSEKSFKFSAESKNSFTFFTYSSASTISLVAKETNYLKRTFKYLDDNRTYSGIYDTPEYSYLSKSPTRVINFQSADRGKVLVVNAEDIEKTVEVFEKFYDKVEVVTLPTLPKVPRSASVVSRKTKIESNYTTKEGTKFFSECASYSIKGIKYFKAEFLSTRGLEEKDTVFLTTSENTYSRFLRVLQELHQLTNKTFVIIRLPNSFASKTIEKGELISLEEYMNKIPSEFSREIALEINNEKISLIWKYLYLPYSLEPLFKNFKKNPFYYNKIFKFLPKEESSKIYYLNGMLSLIPPKEIEFLRAEADAFSKRIRYRLELLLKKYPSLNLIANSCSTEQSVLNLLTLIFGEINE